MARTVGDLKFTVFEPQADSWKDYRTLIGTAAVEVEKGSAKSMGVITASADTVVDFDKRAVALSNQKIISVNFPSLNQSQQQQLSEFIKRNATFKDKVVPLDTILLSLGKNQTPPKQVSIKTDPPTIFFSEKPAILVQYDGEPLLGPVQGMGSDNVQFILNTNWSVLYEKSSKTYYLLAGNIWLSAPSASGSWTAAQSLPADFNQLPNDDSWKDVRSMLGAKPATASQVPIVYTSTAAAEIIVVEGAPKLTAIAGTQLSYVTNTPATLFYEKSNKQYYYLSSGRWFATANLSGPWAFAGNNLPADFKKIPANGALGWVLPSVPGTSQANLAIQESQVPRSASVQRTATLTVTYAGEPAFQPIAGTNLFYAVNTNVDVIKVSDTEYYACQNAVWFKASSPNGPWVVADSIPDAIYQIPVNSPDYQDTYVTVESSNSTSVEYAYTSGYLWGYPWGLGFYYGTGWYYPPYFGYYGGYPYYWGYPRTYVGGTYYNPATGAYARGYGVYGPYGGAKVAAGYNPTTGNYFRGGAAYGPYGGAAAGTVYNPATGKYYHGAAAWGQNGYCTSGRGCNSWGSNSSNYTNAANQARSNPYSSWGSSAKPTSLNTSAGGSQLANRGQTGTSGKNPGSAQTGNLATRGGGNNVFAGNDGNVYRPSSSGNGSWDRFNNSTGNWQPSATNHGAAAPSGGFSHPTYQTSPATYQNLNRDNYARSTGSANLGGYRGGGGGFRGGGGRGR